MIEAVRCAGVIAPVEVLSQSAEPSEATRGKLEAMVLYKDRARNTGGTCRASAADTGRREASMSGNSTGAR